MVNERREWVIEMRARAKGKIPTKFPEDFDKRNDLETPLSPAEEEAKRLEDEAKAAKKDKKKKDGKKKGKKKKKDDDSKNIAKIGPTEVVLKFDEFY